MNTLEGMRVAVVDDVKEQAMTVADLVKDAGMTPSIITEGHGLFTNPKDLMEMVADQGCVAVVCDHRLYQRPFASFFGAEFVASSYRQDMPGVLLSDFASDDARTSIRLHRADIPTVVDRENLEPSDLRQGLLRCVQEMEGTITEDRVAWRVMVRVVGITEEAGHTLASAVIHTRDPNSEIQFPLALVEDAEIRDGLRRGIAGEMRLFADVNVECWDDNDLFFKKFELAPKPDEFEFTPQSVGS